MEDQAERKFDRAGERLLEIQIRTTTTKLHNNEEGGYPLQSGYFLNTNYLEIGLTAAGLGMAIFEGSFLDAQEFAVSVLVGEKNLPIRILSG